MPRPDLHDPDQRAAYRRELRGVARPLRYAAVALLALSTILLALVPAQPTLGYAVLLAGAALAVFGIVKRTRYHRERMAE